MEGLERRATCRNLSVLKPGKSGPNLKYSSEQNFSASPIYALFELCEENLKPSQFPRLSRIQNSLSTAGDWSGMMVLAHSGPNVVLACSLSSYFAVSKSG